jgi:1,4-alpha-glucan branching enzyme
MRIALVSQEYPPETAGGGLSTQTFMKAHGMARLGHDVHVISRTKEKTSSESTDTGIRVTRIPGLDARMAVYTEAADWLTYSTEVAAALAALHAKTPIEVVDFAEWGGEGYVHLLNRTEWNDIPAAIHLHGPLVMFAHTMGWPEMDSEFYRVGIAMEAACVRLADAAISSSRCSADWCTEHYSRKHGQIPVLHTGVDTKLFAPSEAPKSKRPTIVFSGKLVRNKGVHLLVEAACRLVEEFPTLQLRLLGKGEPAIIAELQNIARSSGHTDLLDMPGFVERSKLPAELSRAHVFAAPSQYEGGPGFVYLEAMACGLPVIACEGSGASEIVKHGENGMLVQPEDVNALTNALRSLLKDEDMRLKMGQCARGFVVANADSDVCLRKFESFYFAVASRKPWNAGS